MAKRILVIGGTGLLGDWFCHNGDGAVWALKLYEAGTLNHAVHHIDLYLWMMGMPDAVQYIVIEKGTATRTPTINRPDSIPCICYYMYTGLGWAQWIRRSA